VIGGNVIVPDEAGDPLCGDSNGVRGRFDASVQILSLWLFFVDSRAVHEGQKGTRVS
jgi:hypothetical protein